MKKQKILKWISYGAMAVLIVAMMAATVLERIYGTDFALRWVYHNPAFFVLWGVAAVAGLWLLLERGVARKPFTLLLHAAFVLILAGALVTHLWGESGMIHLRASEAKAEFEREDAPPASLPFSIRLEKFAIEYDPVSGTPADYRSDVTFLPEGRTAVISMNHIGKYGGYRFYQADYDADGRGSILAVGYDPWGVGITYTGYLLLLVAMIGYLFQKDKPGMRHPEPEACHPEPVEGSLDSARDDKDARKDKAHGRFWRIALIVSVGVLLLLWWLDAFPKGPLMPVLRSPLLFIHMIPIMISYALFGVLAVMGLVGLFVREDVSVRLKGAGLRALRPAVFLLTFGTFLGAVWANISWGNYWAWDPKETWALVTLLVYSFPLHGSVLKVLDKPRFFHAFLLVAFLFVLITYFGVNLLLGGMHSYA